MAKSVKSKGTGLSHLFEKDRIFWIEYSGEAEIGIDMSEVKMELSDNDITITIPKAQILTITVKPESYTDDSYVISTDGINKNPILPEEQAAAIKSAQDDMKESVLNNKSLLISAQDRAKQLIENYINQIGEISDTTYNITWNYDE